MTFGRSNRNNSSVKGQCTTDSRRPLWCRNVRGSYTGFVGEILTDWKSLTRTLLQDRHTIVMHPNPNPQP